MKKLFIIMIQAFVASVLAITTACVGTPTTGNKNQTNANVDIQTSSNANAAQPPADKSTATAEQTGTGSIEVKTTPPGARVILIALDEEGAEPQQKGLTPTTLTNIPVGKYTVDIEKPGYKFYQKNIKVQENKTVQVSASLQKE